MPVAPSVPDRHPASERWHALDAVRGLALLLGVLLHASLSYLPGAGFWYIVADQDPAPALGGLFFLVHSFRMLVFFLIAGFFARLLLQRRGTAGFVRDRARRIAAPLLLGWFPIFAMIVAAIVWAAWIKGGGSLPAEPPPGPRFTPDDFPLTHLWFLYLLLLLYAGVLAGRAVLGWLDRGDRLGRWAERGLDLLLRGWAAPLLALPLAWALVATPKWSPWFGIPTPDHSLYPNLAAWVGYGLAFLLGWGIQRQARTLLAILQRQRHLNLGLALLGGAWCTWTLGLAPAYMHPFDRAGLLQYAYAYALLGWGLSLAVLGYALQHLDGYSRWRRYLADASYWIYLLHLPLLMALQVAAAQLAAPWWIEYPLLLALALVLLLASYRWWVRGSWIGAMLNGRRLPASTGPTRAAAASATAEPA